MDYYKLQFLFKHLDFPYILKKNIREFFSNRNAFLKDIECFVLKKNELQSFYKGNLDHLIRNCLVLSEYDIESIINRSFLFNKLRESIDSSPLSCSYYLDKLCEKGYPIFNLMFSLMNTVERECLIRIARMHLNSNYMIGFDSYNQFMK